MNIHLHRFYDKVAVSLIPHDGGTVYLTADQNDLFLAYRRGVAYGQAISR